MNRFQNRLDLEENLEDRSLELEALFSNQTALSREQEDLWLRDEGISPSHSTVDLRQTVESSRDHGRTTTSQRGRSGEGAECIKVTPPA
jgi:hypothetical protein